MEIDKKQYGEYVKQKTPVHSTFKNVLAAFLTGGLICMIGQILLNLFKEGGLEKDAAAAWTLLILILLSVVLTGLISENCMLRRSRGTCTHNRFCQLCGCPRH